MKPATTETSIDSSPERRVQSLSALTVSPVWRSGIRRRPGPPEVETEPREETDIFSDLCFKILAALVSHLEVEYWFQDAAGAVIMRVGGRRLIDSVMVGHDGMEKYFVLAYIISELVVCAEILFAFIHRRPINTPQRRSMFGQWRKHCCFTWKKADQHERGGLGKQLFLNFMRKERSSHTSRGSGHVVSL